jgi:hypothetical protein
MIAPLTPLARDEHFDKNVSEVRTLFPSQKSFCPRDSCRVNHHGRITQFARDRCVDQAPVVTTTQATFFEKLLGGILANLT